MKTNQLIRQQELLEILKISRSTLWRMRCNQLIPPPINISARILGWESSVIEQWLAQRKNPK